MKLLELTQNKVALIDDEDYERVTALGRWQALNIKGRWYALHSTKVRDKYVKVYLHRFVNGTPKGFVTDHKNGDTLDNRKANLRTATHAQNLQNSVRPRNRTGCIKGVRKIRNGWQAKITVNGTQLYLGYFKTEQEATDARMKAEEKYFGEFSVYVRKG